MKNKFNVGKELSAKIDSETCWSNYNRTNDQIYWLIRNQVLDQVLDQTSDQVTRYIEESLNGK